jgi:hypothetical protein
LFHNFNTRNLCLILAYMDSDILLRSDGRILIFEFIDPIVQHLTILLLLLLDNGRVLNILLIHFSAVLVEQVDGRRKGILHYNLLFSL